jgi:hypothetical protein
MICPDTDFDCDNPGCRHGGCQGRRPQLPLLRAIALTRAATSEPGVESGLVRARAVATALNAAVTDK